MSEAVMGVGVLSFWVLVLSFRLRAAVGMRSLRVRRGTSGTRRTLILNTCLFVRSFTLYERAMPDRAGARPLFINIYLTNSVRFFADCAAKKGPPFGAVEVRPQGHQERFAP